MPFEEAEVVHSDNSAPVSALNIEHRASGSATAIATAIDDNE